MLLSVPQLNLEVYPVLGETEACACVSPHSLCCHACIHLEVCPVSGKIEACTSVSPHSLCCHACIHLEVCPVSGEREACASVSPHSLCCHACIQRRTCCRPLGSCSPTQGTKTFLLSIRQPPSIGQKLLGDYAALLVHAGLFCCFHNSPNSDTDYRIFNVHM